jgi:segregation and condensation protein B
MDRTEKKAIVESLIFASDTPLTIQKTRQILENVPKKELQDIFEELKADYQNNSRGFYIQEVAGGYQFRSKPNYASWVKKLKKTRPFRLTLPTLETLAIVAYKQPITRAEIDKIRGVDSGGVIKALLERRLINIAGRKNVPGKPFIFVTTKKFLEVFGLEKLSVLPTIKELDELDDSKLPSLLRESITGEIGETVSENNQVSDNETVIDETSEQEGQGTGE